MNVYKSNIQSDVNTGRLKLRIVVRGYLHIKVIIGYTWDLTVPMKTLRYFLGNSARHKARVQQFDFIGSFIQANIIHRIL